MRAPATTKGGKLAKFQPQAARMNNAKADAVIEYAKQIKDWPLLERAIDEKIEQQQEFVQWWRETISSRHGGDRKSRTANGVLDVPKAEELTGITQQQVSKWASRLKDIPKYRARLCGRAYRSAGLEPEANHGALGTGQNEWYTPAQYIEAAREVMGGIDLDPASSDVAQHSIKAAAHFTLKQDGLKQSWHGRVWLNPPYAQPAIHHFIEKLIEEATAGRVEQAIVLTHNSTDTLWFHRLEEIAAKICFTKGRIAFVDEDGDPCAPTQGQAFFYCGENADGFADVFKTFGFVR